MKTWLLSYVSPLAVLAFLIVGVQATVWVFSPPQFLLPAPSDVFLTLLSNGGLYLPFAIQTVTEVVLGLVISVILGLVLALLLHASPVLRQTLEPFVVFFQMFPRSLTFTPIFLLVFGSSLPSKVMAIALASLFPVMLSVMRGLEGVPKELLDFARTLDSTTLGLYARISLPYSLPQFFTGLKVSMILAFLSTMITEFLALNSGLGAVIIQAQFSGNVLRLAAPIVYSALLALGLYGVILLVEHVSVPWRKGSGPQ